MNAAPLPHDFLTNANWLVQAIDPGARLCRLMMMSPEAYRDASFLDDRLLPLDRESRLCGLDELIEKSAQVEAGPAGWIFHIGHVGSTLVSRLLGELDVVTAIREPRSLRDLAVASDEERPRLARVLERAMSRDGGGGRPIVKATSFVSEFAPDLIGEGATALFMYASLKNYICGILAGENSRHELGQLDGTRRARLEQRGIAISGFDESDAHRAAVAWACEMTALEAAAKGRPDCHVQWQDFDQMLGDVSGSLARCASHFGISASREQIDSLANGPIMGRYSKALEYEYSPALRAELLAEAANDYRSEIADAVASLRQVAASAPLLASALERGGEGN